MKKLIALTLIGLGLILTACPSNSTPKPNPNPTTPVITVTPERIELAFDDDQNASFTIRNTGDDSSTLNWTARISDNTQDDIDAEPWFTLSSNEGSIASGASDTVQLRFTDELPTSRYTATITISSDGGDDETISVILEPADLFVPTTPLAFETQSAVSFSLQNTANSSTTLDFRITSRENSRNDTAIAQWYNVSPQEGSIRGGTAQPITLELKDGIREASGFYKSILCVNYGPNYGLKTCFLLSFDNTSDTDTGSFGLAYDINNYPIPPVPSNVIIQNVPIDVVRSGNFSEAIALEASITPEAGITATFSPNPVASGQSRSLLTIQVPVDAAEGDYVVRVKGTANGKVDTVDVPLTIQAQQQPSFSLSVTDTTLNVQAGDRVSTDVQVNAVGGFTGAVTFTDVNTPEGISLSFDPTSHPSSSTVSIATAPSVPEGTYAITIKGTSGELSSEVRLNLTVTNDDPESARIRGIVKTANDISAFSVPQYGSSSAQITHRLEQISQQTYVPNQILVQYVDNDLRSLANEDRRAALEQRALDLRTNYDLALLQAGDYAMPDLLEVPDGSDIESLVEQLNDDPRVAYAEPNYYIYLQSLPTADPKYREEWHVAHAGLPVAWQDVAASSNKTIAVIDSGIDIDHNDFANGTFYNGYDFCGRRNSNNTCSEDNDPRPDASSDLHGTHVTGIIAAQSNNRGIAGVLHQGAKIVPVKVFHGGNFTTASAFARALRWSAGLSVSNTPTNTHPADIINLSLGSAQDAQVLKDAVNAVAARGVLMVAAVGNRSSNQLLYPAAYPNVMAVGSVNSRFRRSCFSHYGSGLDIVAPGGDYDMSTILPGVTCDSNVASDAIASTTPNNNYGLLFGTSQATPLVTGIAALVWQQNSGLSAAQIRNRLKERAYFDSSYMNSDTYGAGIIRADAALGLPSIGDTVSITATGVDKGDTAIDQVTLNREGTSTAFDLKELFADDYVLEAAVLESGQRLSGSLSVSVEPAQILNNQVIMINP